VRDFTVKIASKLLFLITGSAIFVITSHAEASAQSVESRAAFCAQFKDYKQQTQCIRDEGKDLRQDLDERCQRFTDPAHRMECMNASKSESKDLNPWCPSIKTSDIQRIQKGQRVVVPGVDGCSILFN
jgi:hypothetical protein